MATVDSSIYYSLTLTVICIAAYVLTSITSAFQKPRKDTLKKALPSPEETRTEALTPNRKFSPSWWTSEEIFQLERRAIFSKAWLFVTNAQKFRNPGDYRTFEIAGFSLIVIRGKDNQIRAFHNVCRHRAYAVTKKECGSSTVLRCRYHGWSYDSRGKLIKAPEFEDVRGFERDLNGLWEVKTEIRESMVFINLDAGSEVMSQVLGGIETCLRQWRVNEMLLVEEWKVKGNFNWKSAAGSLSRSEPRKRGLSAFISLSPIEEYLEVFHTSIFCRLSLGQLLTLRLLPLSRTTTMIECNLYSLGSKSSCSKEIDTCKTKIQSAVQKLELQQFADLKQESIVELLRKHKIAEERLGAHIHPAAQNQSFNSEGREDDEFCRELELGMSRRVTLCSANSDGLLDW